MNDDTYSKIIKKEDLDYFVEESIFETQNNNDVIQ